MLRRTIPAILCAAWLPAAVPAATVILVRRTQQTAEPIAARLRLKPVVIAQKDTDALVRQLRAAGDNETVLVVGHADTAPLVIERLGGGAVPPFRDTEYDRLTVIVTGAGGRARVLTLRYGNPSP